MEIIKHAEWSACDPQAFHYRRGREEVDIVLENMAGEISAVEVKAAASASKGDVKALGNLRDRLGDRFKSGVLLYTGGQTIPMGDRLWAVPLSGLWASS